MERRTVVGPPHVFDTLRAIAIACDGDSGAARPIRVPFTVSQPLDDLEGALGTGGSVFTENEASRHPYRARSALTSMMHPPFASSTTTSSPRTSRTTSTAKPTAATASATPTKRQYFLAHARAASRSSRSHPPLVPPVLRQIDIRSPTRRLAMQRSAAWAAPVV